MSEFKYIGCVLDEYGTDGECRRKVTSRRNVAGAIRSLFNAVRLQLGCPRVLHEELFMPVLLYDSEELIWRETDRAVQMDNLRGLLGILGEWIK